MSVHSRDKTEQIPLSTGLSCRAAQFVAVSPFNPKRGRTVRAIYQKYKTVALSCCSSFTQKSKLFRGTTDRIILKLSKDHTKIELCAPRPHHPVLPVGPSVASSPPGPDPALTGLSASPLLPGLTVTSPSTETEVH